MTDDFGPWVPHDDSGRPAGVTPDTIVIADLSGDQIGPMRADEMDWHCPGDPICRYRIRKPRGLTMLQDLIENLPVPAKEHA